MNIENVNMLRSKCQKLNSQQQWECIKRVRTLESRIGKKDIYPYINYDWDYTAYIDNNYNSDVTGATPEGSFKALFKNPIAMGKIVKGFLIDENPGGKSRSGVDDMLDCDTEACNVLREIRMAYKSQVPPKNTDFFKKKLDGEYSSSFYFKIGTCKDKKNSTESDCVKNGGEWHTNQCYQPRYAFVKNKATMGNIPSVMADLANFTPENILNIIDQKDTDDFVVEPCDEHFSGGGGGTNIGLFILSIFSYFAIFVLVLFVIVAVMSSAN
jgi:hypothetical protein